MTASFVFSTIHVVHALETHHLSQSRGEWSVPSCSNCLQPTRRNIAIINTGYQSVNKCRRTVNIRLRLRLGEPQERCSRLRPCLAEETGLGDSGSRDFFVRRANSDQWPRVNAAGTFQCCDVMTVMTVMTVVMA